MEFNHKVFSAVLDTMTDAVMVLDEGGRIYFINIAAETLFGYPSGEIEGNLINVLLPYFHQIIDNLSSTPEPNSANSALHSSHRSLALHNSGKSFPVEISLNKIFHDNNCIYTVALRNENPFDLTLKFSSSLDNPYQVSLDNSVDMISQHDVYGDFLYVSPACKRLLDYEPDELLGQNIYDLLHPDDLSSLNPKRQNNLVCWDMDIISYRIRKKNGAYIWFESALKSIFDIPSGLPANFVAVSRDISVRKETEQTFENNEKYYQIFFETMNKGVLHYDNKGRIISANPAAERIFGVPRGHLIGDDAGSFPCHVIWDDGQKIPDTALPNLVAHVTGQPVTDVEMGVYNQKEDCYRWVIVNAIPVVGSSGVTERVFATYTDITERKSIEQALQQSEQRLRLILDQVNAYIWVVDRNLTVTYVAGAGVANGLILPNDLLDTHMDLYEFFKTDTPDCEPIQAHLQGLEGNTVSFELEYDGWCFHAQTSPLRNTAEAIIGCVGVAIDITESRRAENALVESETRYRQIVETAQEGIWLIDENNNTVFVNKKMAEMLGYSTDEMMGRSFFVFMDQETINVAVNNVERRKKGNSEKHEYAFNNKNGVTVMTRVCTNPIFSDSGDYKGALAMVTDITNELESAAEREKLQHQLQQAQKLEAIGLLTGGIAHDFNNILGSILGYTDLALARFVPNKDSKLAKYLNEVLIAGQRARDLVLQMLTYSRGSDGKRQNISLVPLIKESIKMLRATLPSTVEIRQNYADVLPIVAVDPIQIQQVLTNLCINARDAMEGKGCIDVTLRTVKISSGLCVSCHSNFSGDYLELGVKDTGSGLNQEILHKIFDPFFSTKAIGKGSGMGLPVVHGIMHGYDGHILLDTQCNVGATFRLLMPLS